MKGIVKDIVTFLVALGIMLACLVPITLNYYKQEYEYRRALEEEENNEA